MLFVESFVFGKYVKLHEDVKVEGILVRDKMLFLLLLLLLLFLLLLFVLLFVLFFFFVFFIISIKIANTILTRIAPRCTTSANFRLSYCISCPRGPTDG